MDNPVVDSYMQKSDNLSFRILHEAVRAHQDNGHLLEDLEYLEVLQQRPGIDYEPGMYTPPIMYTTLR